MAALHANHDASDDEWQDEPLFHPPFHPPRREPRLGRRRRFQLPSPAHNPYAYQYPPLLPLPPFVQPPPMARYALRPRRRQGRPVPQAAPNPSWQFSLPELLCPSWSLVLKVVLISVAFAIAMVALSSLLSLVIQAISSLFKKMSEIEPAKVVRAIVSPIGALLGPIGSISITDMWCKTISIGCGPDRDAVFRTETFEKLKRPHPLEQISIGTDYFNCLDDLRILMQQESPMSHLKSLGGKVNQFEHLLAAPEDLGNNVNALAKAWKDVSIKANAARVHGTNGVSKIIDEFPRLLDRSSNTTLAKVSDAFSPAHHDFAKAESFILTSAQGVKKAQELATLVSQQAHRELKRLRIIQNDEESGWAYLAIGLTRFTWNYLQPGWVGRKKHREDAAQFLGELIKVVDESDISMTRNEVSLQQCTIDIAHFGHQLDRDFSLEEPSETLSIGEQLMNLAPRIESLRSKHSELKRKDQAARFILAGAQQSFLLPAGSWSTLEGEGAEQGRGPQCPAGLVEGGEA